MVDPDFACDTPGVDRVEFYKDTAGEYRWRYVRDGNNEVMASGEGYRNMRDCEDAVRYLFDPTKIQFVIKPVEG